MKPTCESFAQIVRDLAILRSSVSTAFGSDTHEFQCSPVMSEAEVLDFEKSHDVRLPEEYRVFLMTVGRGGAGPAYGLFDLGETDENFGFRSWKEKDGFVGTLKTPFPYSEAWNDLAGEPDGTLADTDEDEYERQMTLFEERYYAQLDGAIPICHLGCALRQWLIVSGPEAGNVWDDNRADNGGLAPLKTPSSDRVTFFHWYRNWLDDALAQLPK